jgi:uncharacterized protein (TIGR02145 family)
MSSLIPYTQERFPLVLSLLSLLLLFSCSDKDDDIPFIEEIYSYTSVVIGDQEWMSEDLKNNTFCNGDPIPEIQDAPQWTGMKTAAWVYSNNDTWNSEIFVKLYNWYAVNDRRNICPCGWHVPNYGEWEELTEYLGGLDSAGGKMKSVGTIQANSGLWYEPNTGATNSSGFSGGPNGSRGATGGFGGIPTNGYWWMSTPYAPNPEAWFIGLAFNNERVFRSANSKNYGYAVRCVKD